MLVDQQFGGTVDVGVRGHQSTLVGSRQSPFTIHSQIGAQNSTEYMFLRRLNFGGREEGSLMVHLVHSIPQPDELVFVAYYWLGIAAISAVAALVFVGLALFLKYREVIASPSTKFLPHNPALQAMW
jgi:hypothetical protein